MVPAGMFGEFEQHTGTPGIWVYHTASVPRLWANLFGRLAQLHLTTPAVITHYDSLNMSANTHKSIPSC